MKKIFTCFVALFAFAVLIHAQTPGDLAISATTSTAGGNYAPRNIVAIWIEDGEGNFVKTLLAYAQTRKTHLNTWEATTTAAGSPFNTVDAITGPTRSNHGTRTCTWDGTNVDGNVVDDGTYFVWMELTDKNATGNYSSFSFEKGIQPVNLTPLNVPSFSSISITWEPIFTSVDKKELERQVEIYPNPTSGIFLIRGARVTEIELRNTAGERILTSRLDIIDISTYPDGIYFLKIITEKGIVLRKIVKNSH